MKCTVCIAASADGFIATPDGGVEWLETSGNLEADMGEHSDMGMSSFMASVDCLIMGRKTMEKLSSFELTPEQWPYGDLKIFVLSRTRTKPPANLEGRVEIHRDEIRALMDRLEAEGFERAWIDGGALITSFLDLGLIDEICVTQLPILLGEGLPLYGKLSKHIRLSKAEATAFPNDFVQIRYQVEKD